MEAPQSSNAGSSLWAILTGLNYVPGDKDDEILGGAVADVEITNQFLESLQMPRHIYSFTSSLPSDANRSAPLEAPESWPTFTNLQAAFQEIAQRARAGDIVYIHYSGHGVALNPGQGIYSNSNTGDLALCVFNEALKPRYIRGNIVGQWLKNIVVGPAHQRMPDPGIRMLLVLDCCFSGSMIRGHTKSSAIVRSKPYSPLIDALSPQAMVPGDCDPTSSRDGQLWRAWLIRPTGYSVLTACGPHETAQELKDKSNGVFTFHLIRALTALRAAQFNLSLRTIYEHVRLQIHASHPSQNPVRYGAEKLALFDDTYQALDIKYPAIVRLGEDWVLDAGTVQGVYLEDEYEIITLDALRDLPGTAKLPYVKAVVKEVAPLSAKLLVHGTLVESDFGYRARLITPFKRQKMSCGVIYKSPSVYLDDILSTNSNYVDFYVSPSQETNCSYFIREPVSGHFEIFDSSDHDVTTIPLIPGAESGMVTAIRERVEHLARFHAIEAIENRVVSDRFRNSFNVSLRPYKTDNDIPQRNIVVYEPTEDEDFNIRLTVKNVGDMTLYVYAFDLDSSWAITDLLSVGGAGDAMILPAPEVAKNLSKKSEDWLDFDLWVPESLKKRGIRQCIDIIKIFITSRPISLAELRLPKLAEAHRQLQSTRSHQPHLEEILSGLDIRGSKASSDDWISLNFIVEIMADVEIGGVRSSV